MAILGTLLKKGIKIREILDQEYSSPFELQKLELKKLLLAANETQFGYHHWFTDILKGYRSENIREFYTRFKVRVPVHDYNSIYNQWWSKSVRGQKNVSWPGKVKYFALSSGTSEVSSKSIPVTKEMIAAVRKTSVRQILSLSKYDIPDEVFEAGILMLGGSTDLEYNGNYFSGDLSGITASQLPFWFQMFYKPGKKIAQTRDWDSKLNEISRQAPNWDIGIIVGVPAWIQILLERIVKYHNVSNIHEIWPNLSIYVHGGVFFEPYKLGFEKLLGRKINYIETYLASEGFFAFQAEPNKESMRLVLNNGIFYEFVPFNSENFLPSGEIKENPQTFTVDQIEEGKEYAMLISTCAGAWRYLVGDVLKFTSKRNSEIIITGRTKHFLSLCGEHLSLENMNKAVSLIGKEFSIDIKEFTVAGIPHENLFAHHWYIGTDDEVNSEVLRLRIDEILKGLNDDYGVERGAALKELFLDVVPTNRFYNWMEKEGKVGGQNKFPRVMNSDLHKRWEDHLKLTNPEVRSQ